MSIRFKKELPYVLFFSYYAVLRILEFVIPSRIAILLMMSTIYITLLVKKMHSFDISCLVIPVLIAFYIGFTYILHPEYGSYLFQDENNNIWRTIFNFTSSFWGYIIVISAGNIEKININDLLKKIGILVFLGNFWRPIEVIRNGYWLINATDNSTRSYNMAFGYEIIIPALIFVFLYFEEKKYIYLVISIVSMVEIILFGSRSPVIVYVVFIVFYQLFVNHIFKDIKKLLALIVVILGAIIFFYSGGVESLIGILSNAGFETRALQIFVRGSKLDDSGRNYIYQSAWKLIVKNGQFGFGIYGDQYLLDGQWCHNIFLELLFDFGWFLGTFFIVVIIYYSYKMFVKINNKTYKCLFVLCFSMAFGRLMVSSSFWFDTYFWICIALTVSYRKYARKYNESIIG